MGFECKFEPVERDPKHSNANELLERDSRRSNPNLNHSKVIRSIRMQILTIQIEFENANSNGIRMQI